METVRDLADGLASSGSTPNNMITVVYLESYGKGICGKAGKAYSTTQRSYRMFDVMEMHFDAFTAMLDLPPEEISLWRERGGQPFVSEARLCELSGIWGVSLTPRLNHINWNGDTIPKGIIEMYDALVAMLPRTMAAIDESTTGGKAEGVVVRSAERSTIAKIKFRDYERSFSGPQGPNLTKRGN